MKVLSLAFYKLITIMVLGFTIISCSHDHLADHDDHFEAEGMVFYDGTTKKVEIFRGVTRDTFFVPLNGVTPLIEAKFLSAEKKELDPPDYKKKPLSWSISDTSIVAVSQNENEKGSYKFFLRGKKAGTTSIEFFILHEGHPDYRSGKIPVRVH